LIIFLHYWNKIIHNSKKYQAT